MMIKRILCLLLASLCVSVLVSCGGAAETQSETTAATTAAAETEAAETEPEFPVEKCDFGGEKYTILYPNWFLFNDYFFADEQTGDQMNDALYTRKITVEEQLGVTIDPVCFGYIETIQPKVSEAVLAGDDVYDLALTHCISGVAQMVVQKLLIDWKTLPDVSLESDWWGKQMNDRLAIGDKMYYTVSDFMLGDPNAILFNKGMIDDYKLDNPYALVTDGKWTWDKLTEMSRNVSGDLDGNGVYDENDLYGFVAQAEWKMISAPYSCDQYIVEKQSDGSYALALDNEKMYSIVDKMNNLFNGDKSSFIWKASGNVSLVDIDSNRVLFSLATLNDSAIYRQSEVDFGILPFPKYDEVQKDYISLNWCGLMCVPLSVQNLELAGKTSEMLAFVSRSTTQPAYRDVLLNGKLARDNDSVEMLNIIFDGLVCDFGLNYLGFNDLTYTIPRMVAINKSADFASWYAKNAEKVQADLDKIYGELVG